MTRTPGKGPDRGRTDRLVAAASVLSKKWAPAIVDVLAREGPLGFNDLQGRLEPISAKVLSDSLDDLQESEVLERRVLSEHPLRVEYDLTRRGADLRPIVSELADWADEHLSDATPTVLVADDDRRVADMHADWVGEAYEVRTAHDHDGIREAIEDGVDLLVLDRGLGPDGGDTVRDVRSRVDAPVLVCSSTEPDFDLVDLPCDDYLRKPTDPATLLDHVEALLDRADADPTRREFLALRSRKRALDRTKTGRQREESGAYARLEDRLAELESRLDETPLEGAATDGGPVGPTGNDDETGAEAETGWSRGE